MSAPSPPHPHAALLASLSRAEELTAGLADKAAEVCTALAPCDAGRVPEAAAAAQEYLSAVREVHSIVAGAVAVAAAAKEREGMR